MLNEPYYITFLYKWQNFKLANLIYKKAKDRCRFPLD